MLRGAVAYVGVLISSLRECTRLKITTGQRKIRFAFFAKTVCWLGGASEAPFSLVWAHCSSERARRAQSSCPGASPTRKRRRRARGPSPPLATPHTSLVRLRRGVYVLCTPNSPPDRTSAPLLSVDGRGHQKRGDHRNDRSPAQRSQSNRLKCNRHVKATGQFIPHPSLFEIHFRTTGNLPFPAKPS